jgi:type I restriction enzyme R subunit
MNSIQTEAQLENTLIKQLQGLEYEYIMIKDESDLIDNLKKQIEIHNFSKLN